jgi:His-Xaa-Ser system protein HxsD
MDPTYRMNPTHPTHPITRDLSAKGLPCDRAGYNLTINTQIYGLEAIKKTAYKFADRASIVINPAGADAVSISFIFVGRHAASEPDQLIADFGNELLDQDLREIIKRESTPLRNLILAHAFSRTSLLSER